MPVVLNGKELAYKVERDLHERKLILQNEYEVIPQLATILVGDNRSSKKYVELKTRAGQRIGINVINYELPGDVQGEELGDLIQHLNSNHSIHGILLQHPVPEHLLPYEGQFFDQIDPSKDVDGVTSLNFGKLALRRSNDFKPATPYGIMKLLKHYNYNLTKDIVVIVGASPILGKPLSLMFENDGATVILCNKNTQDFKLKHFIFEATIVVGACGVPNRIKAEWIQEWHTLIDAGYKDGKGDIEQTAWEKSYAYTPIPNGVGPMTISTLLSQTIRAAERFANSSWWSYERHTMSGWVVKQNMGIV